MDHYDCIRPLLFIQQCFGLGAFYAKKQNDFKPREYYTKKRDIYVALMFMAIVCVGAVVKEWNELDESKVHECFLLSLIQITAFYETYFGIFLFFVTYIMSFKYRFIIMEAHSMIDEVDQTLRSFQYEIPYKKIRNYSSVAILILLLSEMLIIVISEQALMDDFSEIIYSLLECIPNLVYTISIGVFINFMFCLRYRFRALNDLLVKNFKEYASGEKDRVMNEKEFDLITKTHEKLCDVSDSVSDAFSMILFCVSAYLFVLIIIEVFASMRFIIIGMTYDSTLFISIAFLLLYVLMIYAAKLSFLVFSTELVISESSKTHAFAHKSINCYSEEHIRNKLTIFLMQLINRKPTFTACGLFEINLPLLFSMVGALFTYVIILIQFDQSDKGCIDNYFNNSTESNAVDLLLPNSTISLMNTNTSETSTTSADLIRDLESKLYLNLTDFLDTFSTNITTKVMNMVDYTKNMEMTNGFSTFNAKYEENENSTDLIEEYQNFSIKILNVIQNITDVNLLKNVTSSIEDLLFRLNV